jgi:hypothetical protein
MSPFSRYVPLKEGEAYVVEKIFSPSITFSEQDFSMKATTPSGSYTIYSIDDIIHSTAKENGAASNFQGLLGERILSVVLEELVHTIIEEVKVSDPCIQTRGRVLREQPEYEGKNYAFTFNNRFLLRYNGKTNFYLLRKRPFDDPDSWYEQERLGLIAREIDGMAFLHIGEEKYLLIGEAKTITSWRNIDDSGYIRTVTEELFPPFRSLFPRHNLVFVFLAKRELIYEDQELKDKPSRIAEALASKGVQSVFIPFPKTEKKLADYARNMSDLLPLTRKIILTLMTK